eukprot:212192_1
MTMHGTMNATKMIIGYLLLAMYERLIMLYNKHKKIKNNKKIIVESKITIEEYKSFVMHMLQLKVHSRQWNVWNEFLHQCTRVEIPNNNQGIINLRSIKQRLKCSKVKKGCHNHKCSYNLGVDGKIKVCSKCRVSYYCSRSCQKKHWKYIHRVQCKLLAGLFSVLI